MKKDPRWLITGVGFICLLVALMIQMRDAALLRSENSRLRKSTEDIATLKQELDGLTKRHRTAQPTEDASGETVPDSPTVQSDLKEMRAQLNQMATQFDRKIEEASETVWQKKAPAALELIRNPNADPATLAGAINVLQLAGDRNPEVTNWVLKNFSKDTAVPLQVEMVGYLQNVADDPRAGKLLTEIVATPQGDFGPMVRYRAVDVLAALLPNSAARDWLELVARDDSDVNFQSHVKYALINFDLNHPK